MPDTQQTRTIVDIVIVNYNGGAFIAECLTSLLAQTMPDFRVFVVDNASTDGSAEALELPDSRFGLIENAENTGFAAACNQAAALGSAPWIAMLNPDTRPAPDWLETTLAYAEETGAAMIGCKQISMSNPGELDGAGDVYSPLGLAWRGGFGWPEEAAQESGEVFGPCAAAALYDRSAFMSAGGFDESFFCYVEDVDLAFRMRLYGHTAVQCQGTSVAHFGSGISGRRSEFTIYHGTRNRIWTWFKNTPPLMLWLMTPAHVLANGLFLVRSLYHNRFYATGRAIRDAFRDLPRVFRERREIQNRRVRSSAEMLNAMTISPSKLLRRAPDIRPIKPPTS